MTSTTSNKQQRDQASTGKTATQTEHEKSEIGEFLKEDFNIGANK
jgi:hypothetical protein